MRPIAGLERVPGPFALATTDAAFPPARLEALEALFEREQAWVRHQEHFYRCFIAEVDGQLPEPWLEAMREQVAQVLELDLAGPVRVTAQRMEASDGSDRHTDRPLAGYEAARLVVQLDGGEGGRFRAFDGEEVWIDRPPRPNGAVAFELCATSAHDVTECRQTRRTVVFHFWHRDNPIDAREQLDAELAGLSFADLPAALEPAMARAEALLDEDTTYRAAAVVWLLWRWGAPDLVGAYARALQGRPGSELEARAAGRIRLHLDGFG